MNLLMIFSIFSFIYIITTTIIYTSKKKVNTLETKLYSLILIILIIEICLEFTMRLLAPHFNSLYFLNEIVSKLFIFTSIVWFTLMTYYNFIVSNKNEKDKKLVSKILLILSIISLIMCFVLPIEFYFESNNNYYSYTYGSAVTYTFIVFFALMFFNIGILFINKKNIANKKYIPILVALIALTICGIIQKSNPELTLNLFAQSLVTFIMFNTIENPDVKLLEYEQKERQKLLDAAESKSEFLSSTSHELRTPLNAIIGLSEDIESFGTVNPGIVDDVKDIVTASNILLDIISNILDSSKIESGKLDIVESDYYPHKEYENIINIYRVKAFRKNLTLISEISNNVPEVLYGDKQRIKQIISNLLDNAIRFTDVGKINISLDFNLDNLIIKISDTGKGMSLEEVNTFTSKENDLKIEKVYSATGSGLGLSITKNLIKILHGNVMLESTQLVGTKYVITIPQKLGNKSALEELEKLKEIDLTKIDYSGKKLLIVDDNPINIKVLKKAVATYNFVIDECYNGKDAIEKIELNNNYDLVFMDIMMPVMGGEEAMNKLKQMPNFKTKVVALTADAVSGATEKYKTMGFNDYLSKPFSRDMVANKLYSVLGRGEDNE